MVSLFKIFNKKERTISSHPHPSTKVVAFTFPDGYGGFHEDINDIPKALKKAISEIGIKDHLGGNSTSIHSEIAGMVKANFATECGALVINHACCPNCAKALAAAGFNRVIYDRRSLNTEDVLAGDISRRRGMYLTGFTEEIFKRAGIRVEYIHPEMKKEEAQILFEGHLPQPPFLLNYSINELVRAEYMSKQELQRLAVKVAYDSQIVGRQDGAAAIIFDNVRKRKYCVTAWTGFSPGITYQAYYDDGLKEREKDLNNNGSKQGAGYDFFMDPLTTILAVTRRAGLSMKGAIVHLHSAEGRFSTRPLINLMDAKLGAITLTEGRPNELAQVVDGHDISFELIKDEHGSPRKSYDQISALRLIQETYGNIMTISSSYAPHLRNDKGPRVF